MKTLLAAFTFLLMLLMPTLAHAIPVTFGFTGNGSLVSTLESISFLGDYTFDSAAIGIPSLDRGTGYASVGPPYGMHITFGGTTLTFTGLGIQVLNDRPSFGNFGEPTVIDRYKVQSAGIGFSILSCSGNAFDSEALPLTINYVAAFSTFCDEREDHEFAGAGVLGNLTSLFVAAVNEKVPEPSAWWLLTFSLIGGWTWKRGLQKSASWFGKRSRYARY